MHAFYMHTFFIEREFQPRKASRQFTPLCAMLERVVERVLLDELTSLASHQDATVEARAAAIWGLAQIAEHLQEQEPNSDATEAHYGMALSDIDRFFSRVEEAPGRAQPLRAPPGTPHWQPLKEHGPP